MDSYVSISTGVIVIEILVVSKKAVDIFHALSVLGRKFEVLWVMCPIWSWLILADNLAIKPTLSN